MVDASVLLQQVTAAMARPRHALRARELFAAFSVALLEREDSAA